MSLKPAQPHTDSGRSALDQQIAQQQRRLKQSRVKKAVFVCLAITVMVAVALSSQLFFSDRQTAGRYASEPALSAEQKEQLRDEFMQSLLHFEEQWEPLLGKAHIQSFDRDEFKRITTAKDVALTAFARSEFIVANRSLEEAQTRATTFVEGWEAAFESLYEQAAYAFVTGDIDAAQFAYQQARQRNPESEKLTALGKRIYAFDQVEQLLAQYRAAIVENNTPKQIQLLTAALKLDPARTDLKPLIEKLENVYEKQRVGELVKQANHALEANDVAKAASLIAQAREINDTDAGVRAAMQSLQKQEKTSRLIQLLVELQGNVQADNWENVSQLVAAGLREYPNNQEFAALGETANAILAKRSELTGFLGRPTAFYDASFRQRVRSVIEQNVALYSQSAALAEQAASITDLLEKMETPVTVTFTSDGNTDVTVFKVASLGRFETLEKAILPGVYRVQGRCEGFQTVQKTLQVKAQAANDALHIACETRI